MKMPTRVRSSLVLAAAVASAALSRASGPSALDRLAPAARYDEPQKARDFYVEKRAPVGGSTIPVERYRVAREQVAGMALYSTRAGGFAARGGVGLAAATALGTWSALGPGNIGGRTRAVAIHPSSPSTMYAAGVAGGVFKTTDGGASWTAKGDALANLAVSTLALRPGSPNTLLAGTGEGFFNGDAVRGAGIFRTTDGGDTWEQIEEPGDGAPSDFHYVNKIVFYPGNPIFAFAATNRGVFRSSNAGQSWTRILSPTVGGSSVITGGCLDLAIRPDDDTLFASCGTFTAARVYRTQNATAGTPSWSYSPSLDGNLLSGYLTESRMGRTSLAIAPSSPDVVYAVAADNLTDALWAVYYSADGGDNWETRAPLYPGFENALLLTNVPFAWPCPGFGSGLFFSQGWYDNVVAVDPTDPDRVWVGGIDLFRSDDGGFHFGLASYWWTDAADPSYAHADHHAIVFHPAYNGSTNQQMFVGNDGGVFKLTNARSAAVATGSDVCDPGKSGAQFTSLNNGYGVTQFYYGAVYPDDKQYLGGTQDNGTIYSSDTIGPEGWSELLGGDGGAVAVDPLNTDILYAENTYDSIRKCTLGVSCTSASFVPKTSGISDSGFLFIAPFVMDPGNRLRLFTGGTYLWRTINGAEGWQRASAAMAASVSAIAVAPGNGEYALVGTKTGFIHRSGSASSTGSGTNWPKVQPRTGYVSSVAFDPYDPNVAYATYSTFNDTSSGPAHVFKSTNAGASWTGLPGTGSNKLPDIPVHAIAVDPTQPGRLYLGTDLGVFVSVDGGLNWAQENTQFPGTVTEQLVVSGANLYAFTHGRGVFRVPLTSVAGQTVRLDMVATASSVPEGPGPKNAAVQFTVRTSNHANVSSPAPTVHVKTVDGTAEGGSDYTALDTDFTVPLGTPDGGTFTVNVPILDDPAGEPPETFTVELSNPSPGLLLSRRTHTATITNDGDPVGIKVLDLAVTEGNSATSASVVVKLNFPADQTVEVTATTAPDTATAPADYQHKSQVLTFAVGESSKAFPVSIVGDTVAEPPKSFFVNLSSPSASGAIEDAQAVVTLNDNDFSGTLQLSAPRYTFSEGAGKAVITVSRTGGVASGVGFNLVTQDGTAASPDDFAAVGPGPFSFAAGATTRTVEVPLANDTQDEPDEAFVVRLWNPTGYGAALGPQQTAVVTLADNDAAGVLQFSSSTNSASEAAGAATLTVSRANGNTGPLTVDVNVTGGTASGGGVDYSLPAQLTFNANQASVPLTVTLSPDALFEGNETVELSLANPTGGATLGARSTAVLTIVDAQPTLFFAAPAFTVSEAKASAVVTVKRAGPLTDTVTVNYATSAGSATPGQDYTEVAGPLAFGPNVSTKSFTVPLITDAVVDGDETVNLTLSGPSGGTPPVELGAPATAVLAIAENDKGGEVYLAAASYSVKEPGTTTPVKLSVVVKRKGGTAQDASVVLSTVDGGAQAGLDFTGVAKTLVFPAGKTALTEVVEILPDALPEGPETFALTLTSPGGGATLGAPATATATIVDNEPVVEWSAAAFKGKEPTGTTPTSTALLTVKRTGSTAGDATVDVRVSGGSAALGSDFVFSPNPQTLALPSGKGSVTLPIVINQDSLSEGAETIDFTLENPSPNAALGARVVTTLNVTDDEPVVQLSAAAYSVGEPTGTTPGNAVITVKRLGSLTAATNVDFATSDLTAAAGEDYDAVSGTLSFAAGASSLTFKVPIRPDSNDEPDETFRVTLGNLTGAGTLGAPVQADVKIKDNDTAGKIQLAAALLSVEEGAGSVTLTVTRKSGTGIATVDYATASGGADSGTDFAATVGTLTFGVGETSKTISILIADDGASEGGESFTLTLSNPGNRATLGTPATATVWIVDNE
jgi:hypothetical protein